MRLFKQENYKLFVKRYFFLMLTIMLILDVGAAYKNIKSSSSLSYQSLCVYKEYINQFQGDLTDEKIKAIEKIREETELIFEQQDKLNEDYKNEVITLEEYEKSRAVLNENQSKIEGFNAFLRVYDAAMLNDLQIVDPIVWTVMLTENGIDIFAITLVIILVILLCVRDREIGMDYIKSATPNGKKELWRTQIFIIVSLSIVIGLVVSALKYGIADLCYGLSGHFFKLQNIEGFENSTKNLTIFSAYIIESLFKTLGLVYLAILTYAIGMITNSSLYTAFFSFTFIYLPAYVFGGKRLMCFLPLPSALLIPSVWLKSNSGKTAFNEPSTVHIVIYIAVVFAFSAVFLFLADKLRERRNIT